MLAHKVIRGTVLALMFFLVGTAYCSTDSYDPDPYDDTPPVVTVEFNYVVPSRVSIRRPNSQNKHRQNVSFTTRIRRASEQMTSLFEREIALTLNQRPLQMVVPLRC
ncbi:MAG: hypothetical protein WA738_20685 [Candidatus Angelobacter sp.]